MDIPQGSLTRNPKKCESLRGKRMSQKARWYKRIGPFLKEVRAEMKKVTWPSRNEVYSTTIVVIIATLFFGFYLYLMDLIFSWVISQIQSLF
jgi:preprotein translocase subunit SecE